MDTVQIIATLVREMKSAALTGERQENINGDLTLRIGVLFKSLTLDGMSKSEAGQFLVECAKVAHEMLVTDKRVMQAA